MRTLLIASVVVVFISVCLLTADKQVGALDDNRVLHNINCTDIPGTVKLIGRFGVPLGEEVVTIRGKWKDNPNTTKPDYDPTTTSDFNFVVTEIGGKAIQNPIEIPWTDVEPLLPHGSVLANGDERKWVANLGANERLPKAFDGDEWEMMGFERGRTMGWPRQIAHMYRRGQYLYGPGAFVNTFCFASVRMFGKPHDKSEVGGYRLSYVGVQKD